MIDATSWMAIYPEVLLLVMACAIALLDLFVTSPQRTLTYVVTLATNPALALPCGVDAQGMPFGLQLIGELRQDAKLLAMSHALEMALAANPSTARPKPDTALLRQSKVNLKDIVTHPPVFNA
mgnify:FL=1